MNKLYDLYIDYEDFFNCLFILIIIFILLFLFLLSIEKANKEEISIITNTKDYYIFKKCRNIDGLYYCYQEVKND